MKKTSSKDQVLIGRVGSPSGLRGEVRITLYQQDSTNLKEGKVLLLKRAEKNQNDAPVLCLRVERVRYQKERPVVKLEGVDDRSAAEELRGLEVYIDALDLEPLPEGEHYVRNIIGCRVIDVAGRSAMLGGQDSQSAVPCGQDSRSDISSGRSGSEDAVQPAGPSVRSEHEEHIYEGREVGVLRDVIQNTAQNILEVETAEGKTVLIPAVDEFLVNIDEEARIIEVKLIPGFID